MGTARIGLGVRLRYCDADDACFSLATGRNDEYALYHPGASYEASVRRNSSYDVGPMVSPTRPEPSSTDQPSLPVLCDLVDTVRTSTNP